MRAGGLKWAIACLMTIACLAVSGCDAPPQAGEEGSPGALPPAPAAPERVVSLVPAATEILLALGMLDRIVARNDFDRDPSLQALPSVGGGLHPSMERLVAVEPDLVIRFEGEQDRATPAALDRAGIAHIGVRPDRIEDVRRIVLQLGGIMGVPGRAETLVAELDRELDEVRAGAPSTDRPRVAFLLGGSPPWAVGPDTFLSELLEIAGGENVLADAGPLYGPVSVETILARRVDLILIPEGNRLPAALAHLPVRRVPEAVQSPGLGLGSSARAIARAIADASAGALREGGGAPR
jgi:iron complex transport system substrate-binding protein